MHHYPRKRFGQHFLHDQLIIQRIIDAIDPVEEIPIIEIGPGQGALTIPLLKQVKTLDVIEIDRDLAHSLNEKCADMGTLRIHITDVLDFDFRTTCKGNIKVIGNLPYNISTPLLFHLLDQLTCIEAMVLMLQKEVADRICAKQGSKDYGRLSIMIQSQCEAENLFSVGPGAFTPPPKVESSVIRLQPLSPPVNLIKDRQLFSHVVKQAFTYRRKTLRNSLRGVADASLLNELGIKTTNRAQDLNIKDYIAIANLLFDKRNQ